MYSNKINTKFYKELYAFYSMDKITIPASMTLEKGISIKRYKWKSKNKESIYKKKCRRAFIRFMCKNLAQQISKLEIDKRQILYFY